MRCSGRVLVEAVQVSSAKLEDIVTELRASNGIHLFFVSSVISIEKYTARG